MPINPYETSEETARRALGAAFDPNAPMTMDHLRTIRTAEEEVRAARRAAELSGAPAAPPPPLSPEDKIGAARQKATELRREREAREALVADARELVAADHPGLGDVSDLGDDELLELAGFQQSSAEREAELAQDYAANDAAAESGPGTFEQVARERAEREVAADRERQESWGNATRRDA